MADIKSLRSYLVSLGFQVNTSQLAQFNNAIQSAAQVVDNNTTKIISNVLKWQGVVVGMFDAVGVSVVALMDKTAMADQSYRLLGQTMFMDTEHAKTLKIAMDALGLTLNQIAFDPEANARYAELQTFQQRLLAMEGFQNFEQSMIQVRNAQMEFAKFQISMLYFRDFLTRDIFNALGGERLTLKLREWNDYIVVHLPEWSRIISTYIVPVLQDAWNIMKDLWQVGKDFAQLFTNIVGLFSGDPTLQGQVSFEKFAKALEHVANMLAYVLHLLFQIEGILVGGLAGGAIGTLIGGAAGLITGGPVGALAGAATGGFIGTGVGAGAGGIFDLIRQGWHDSDLDAITQGVSMVESGGHQTDQYGRTLTSSAGALGIMQLMPGTAKGLGVDPYNATQNYAGGRAYLQQLFGKYGNWHDALSAYNWGPGNVDKALRQHTAFPSSVEAYAGNVMGRAANIQIGEINIMQPNASPEQIKHAIVEGIREHQNDITSANLVELRAAY